MPVPRLDAAGWSRAGETRWSGNAGEAALGTDASGRTGFVHAAWTATDAVPVLEVVSRAEVRDRAVDMEAAMSVPPVSAAERAVFTAPTALIPTDGIVRETSLRITAELADDAARPPRNLCVDRRQVGPRPRDARLRLGRRGLDARGVRPDGRMRGLNAPFVGLARATGIPARDVSCIRLAPSAFGYEGLGAGSPDVMRAQHCRAEAYLHGIGRVAADPADVRKVMPEEPPRDLAPTDP